MFNSKKESLVKGSTKHTNNAFINKAMNSAAKTGISGNGAVKYTTTGSQFIDQFGQTTGYKAPRKYADIAEDARVLHSIDPQVNVKFTLYLRLITRKVQLPTGDYTQEVQRGQGLKNEGIMRMIWLGINHPTLFWNNINLFISAGSWKDVFQMLSIDLQYNGWNDRKLDWDAFGNLILAGLENPNTSELVKKYLPSAEWKSGKAPSDHTIEKQSKVLIGKWLVGLLYPEYKGSKNKLQKATYYKAYRKIKSSGTAHAWQQLISKGQLSKINFDTVAGRALMLLVSGKFIDNNNLKTRYTKWIESKPVAKFTGYPYELLKPLGTGIRTSTGKLQQYQITTINKQFMQLVETAKDGLNGKSGFLVVLDTSRSMTGLVDGKVSAYSVGKSLALFFSYMLKGEFEGHWMEFNDTSKLKSWVGNTPVDRYVNDKSEAYGGTNFQSVAQAFIRLKRQGVPESDFPTGILAISDGEFNSTSRRRSRPSVKTNTEVLLEALRTNGFSKEFVDNFKIVFWDIRNDYYGKGRKAQFETYGDFKNVFYLSGFDGAVVSFLFGKEDANGMVTAPKTAEELFDAAMNQELLEYVS